MPIIYNGTTIKKLIYNGVTVHTCIYNGVTVFTAEEEITPTWSLSGSGWTDTTWGSWSVGRDEGDLLIGSAQTVINTNGHSILRFTPTGTGWNTGRSRGAIRIYINGSEKFSLGAEQTRTAPVDIDISAYSGNITVNVDLQADWGYTDMYTDTRLMLIN